MKKETRNVVVLDWEDKIKLQQFFPSCWSYFTCEDILATDWEEVEG